jgi:D-aspartate ligase
VTRPRPPVLVLGSGLTVLGAIRLLGRAGFAPLVVSDRPGIAKKSRWYRAAPPSRSTSSPWADLPAWLEGLPLERAILLPCGDDWALQVARCASEVADRFPTSISGPDCLHTLIDKGRLACVLDDLDLPRPRTIPVDSEQDDLGRRHPGLEHAFLKPRDSAAFHAQFGVKAFQVTSEADLAARLADVRRFKLSVQLQEYVPGPPSNHYYVEGFIDREERRRALFVRRRLRMYPADFGNSTFFESVDPSAVSDAVATLTTLLSHVRYRGMFSAEFKRDARDGVCRLIEVNARPWWFVEFAGQCGVNVCAMSVLDALGEEVPEAIGYRVGKSCVYPYYDYFACRELYARGELTATEWLRSWLRSTQPVLRWSDPFPALSEAASLVKGRASSYLRRAS